MHMAARSPPLFLCRRTRCTNEPVRMSQLSNRLEDEWRGDLIDRSIACLGCLGVDMAEEPVFSLRGQEQGVKSRGQTDGKVQWE